MVELTTQYFAYAINIQLHVLQQLKDLSNRLDQWPWIHLWGYYNTDFYKARTLSVSQVYLLLEDSKPVLTLLWRVAAVVSFDYHQNSSLYLEMSWVFFHARPTCLTWTALGFHHHILIVNSHYLQAFSEVRSELPSGCFLSTALSQLSSLII